MNRWLVQIIIIFLSNLSLSLSMLLFLSVLLIPVEGLLEPSEIRALTGSADLASVVANSEPLVDADGKVYFRGQTDALQSVPPLATITSTTLSPFQTQSVQLIYMTEQFHPIEASIIIDLASAVGRKIDSEPHLKILNSFVR